MPLIWRAQMRDDVLKGKAGVFFRVRTAIDGSIFFFFLRTLNKLIPMGTTEVTNPSVCKKKSLIRQQSALFCYIPISTCPIHLSSIINISPSARCVKFSNILKNRSFSWASHNNTWIVYFVFHFIHSYICLNKRARI